MSDTGETFNVLIGREHIPGEPFSPDDPEAIEWSRRHFALIKDGGMWAVPRSGLIFRRQGDRLVLTESMPWEPAMRETITPAQLAEQQADEFNGIREAFGAAGIEVVRKEDLNEQ